MTDTPPVPPRRRKSDDAAVIATTNTLRMVVAGLVAVAILSIIAATLLMYEGKDAPNAVIGIGSTAVGALATLIARTGRVNND